MIFIVPKTVELISSLEVLAKSAVSSNKLGNGRDFLYDQTNDFALLLVEASLALYHQLRNAGNRNSVCISLCSFYHAVTGKSCVGSALRLIDTLVDLISDELPFWQSGNTWLEVIDGLYSNTKRVVKSALGDKIAKVFNHVIAISIYDKMGIEFDPVFFGKIEKKHIRPTVWNVVSFLDAIVGLVIFLCKAGRQAMLTGSIECFFIDDMVLTRWLDEASSLRKNAEFISNPTAVGMALPQYLHDVKSAVETGKKLLPHFRSGREHTIIMNTVLELETILKRQQCAMMAASFRRAPIGVFLYGTAGVAKSFIATGLFNHYCSVRGISQEAATMWTRTENDDYYSGYKSHFAGVLYDDAAKYRTNVVQGVDPSIGDIISAINNIQFVTPQADLPDKGKIPFRSEWVGVTSNVGDLAADMYFNSSAAFLRRFTVKIEPIVKPEYVVTGQDKIDTSKIPEGEQYPNLWDFKVYVPVVNGMRGEFKLVLECEYPELLEYMTEVYTKHIKHQDKLMETVGKIGPEKLCKCNLPESICKCQSEEDGTILFGTFRAVMQSDVVCTKSHWDRVGVLNSIRSELMQKHVDKVERAFVTQLFEDDELKQWFNPTFCDDSIGTTPEIVDRFRKHLESCMAEFLVLDPRDRLNALTENCFSRVDDGDDLTYLTFTPKFGPRGHFLETQFAELRNTIVTFSGPLTPKEQALMDVYVQEQAPAHIAAGWTMGDIIRGGLDYVKFYSKELEDPERERVREFLMGTRETRWYERLGVRVARAYFENRVVYTLLNAVSSVPVVRSLAGWLLRQSNDDPHFVLGRAGREHDYKLGGGNKFVRLLLASVGAVAILAMVAKLASAFSRKTCDSVVTKRCDDVHCEPQMDLNTVGRKPQLRESEKENVWTTPERAITKLDVDPRRPHNEQQAVAKVRNNTLVARVRGKLNGRMATANTRILVIDSETFVVNNHSLPVGATVEIWLGPQCEEGVKPSFVVCVDERMVVRKAERDIAIVHTIGMPHRFSDIKNCIAKRSFQSVGSSFYLVRHPDHSLENVPCVGVTQSCDVTFDGTSTVMTSSWRCKPTRVTVTGECGSPLFINSGLGSVVVGIHAAYSAVTNTAWAARIYREDFDDSRHPCVGYTTPAYPVAQTRFVELMPSDKLYTDYHRNGHMMTHGQLKCFVARPKFTGRLTPYAARVLSVGEQFSPPIVDNMSAPVNAGWKQPQLVLQNYLQPTHSMSEVIMLACVEAYCEHFEAGLTDEDRQDLHPVPLDVAVNGFPGVPNVDAQKHATSAGHGKRGPKLQFLSEPERYEEWESYRRFDEATMEEVNTMREAAYRGVRPHAIYDACWKNEMLAKHKVEAGKARSIYMCPLAFLTNVRMSTMGLCRVMIRRRDLFGIAVGLNTHSEEWDDLNVLASAISGDNWVAGDFQAFEAVLNLLISNSVSRVFVRLARAGDGFTEDETMALRVWLADISNATINFFGELITLLGGEASGHQLTTFFNCVANNLLHMYAYVVIHKTNESESEYLRCAREFFSHVFRNTLGDDVYLKVSPERPMYNHTTIQQVFETIGVVYTMAEKGAASRPYIPLEEVTFLKRSFSDHSAFPGVKVATLDRKSIYKMLLYTVPSNSASAEEQLASALASAQAEAFFHDWEFFEQVRLLIESLPKTPELEVRVRECPPPSWNTMIARFMRASPKLQARMLVPGIAETTETRDSYCPPTDVVPQTEWSVDPWGSTTMGRSPEDRVYGGVRLSAKSARTGSEYEITPDPDNNDFSKNMQKNTQHTPTTNCRDMAPKVVVQAINKVRQKQRRSERRHKWEFQADVTYDTVSVPGTGTGSSHDHVQEQIVFKNEPTGVTLATKTFTDSIKDSMVISQDVGSYLTRPRLIYSYVWAENGANGAKVDFQPWALFFNDTNMANKLKGYHLMSAELHLKFLINGSPFYYGSMMATYTPLNGYRLDSAEAVGVEVRLCATSQKPHVWLENQNCSTAEMVLPFLYPYPMMNINVLANLTNMGTVHLVQYAPLLSANGTSSSNVDIQVFAWAENVKLSGPSDRPVMQSEFVHDGQISGPASTVAGVASRLKDAPLIGPYAKATEMAATAVGDIARFFGFTNVPNVADVGPVKQTPFSLASSEISEPVQKLSLQAKQETSLGAVQHGGEAHDELNIKRFCGRTAYLCGPTWSTTNAPGDILFTTTVCPQQFVRTSTEMAHPPMSYLANFFQYWRGSIKYTFKVVRSPYHRGRLQVSWDSGTSDLSQGPGLGNPNTLTTVMDLDEDSECSFVVPYMQPDLFTKTYSLVAGSTGGAVWSTSTAPTGVWPRSNGVLNVRVLNRLTAPEASSSATVLVFVSACDDMEFAGPVDWRVIGTAAITSLNSQTVATPQSDVQYNDESEAAELMPRGDESDIYKQVFGERIVSLREYMHRSSLSSMWYPGAVTTDVGSGGVNIPIKRMPPPPGVMDNGWWSGTTSSGTGQSVFYTKFHPIVAFAACFIGYKGSVNVNVNVDQPANSLACDTLQLFRLANGDALTASQRRPYLYTYSNPAVSANINARADIQNVDAGRAGIALTNTKTNAGLSANLPYYSSSGFQIVDPRREYSNGDSFTDRNADWWKIEWRYNKNSATTSAQGSLTSIYYATGPDFDLTYFINVPVLTVVNVTAA